MASEYTVIAKYIAGSQSYGLDTPTSDVDVRGVYLIDALPLIIDPYAYIGNRSLKSDVRQNDVEDISFHELRHFFHILRAANSNAVEMLFNEDWIFASPLFKEVQQSANLLLDPEKMFKSLEGYMISELKLATGERTGKLGGKRQAQVEKLGFSPKNFVQLIRLAWAGAFFYQHGRFPVYIEDEQLRLELKQIKLFPEDYTKQKLIQCFEKYRQEFRASYEAHRLKAIQSFKYSDEVAALFMLKAYKPTLDKFIKPPGSFWSKITDWWAN